MNTLNTFEQLVLTLFCALFLIFIYLMYMDILNLIIMLIEKYNINVMK